VTGTGTGPATRAPWSVEPDDLLGELDVVRDRGLSAEEVRRRRRRFGPNALRRTRSKNAWRILLDQVRSLVVALLGAAAAVSFLFGEWVEGLAILAVLAINTLLGFVAELRAVRSMEALRRLGALRTRVRRAGAVREIPAEALVPGDVVLVEGGDVVTADLRLLEASRMQSDESTLTGESVPVDKDVAVADADAPIHERTSMLFKGTAVARGAGEGVVVATGMATELGRIARLVEEAKEEITPLEKRLEALGRRLVWLTLAIALVTSLLGILAGKELFLMIETGIALAVAAIPEGLPIVATIALARGMWRMARRNALVNRLSAVEVLGATTIIFTDKTGTLTENRLSLARVALLGGDIDFTAVDPEDEDPALRSMLRVGVLCNNASLAESGPTGDPLEVALLEAGARLGLHRDRLLEEIPEVREEAFDPASRRMATVHRDEEGFLFAVKGAAEAVLEASSSVLGPAGREPLPGEGRRAWLERNEAMARAGLRVLGVASKSGAEDDPVYEDLAFIGLVGFFDPPRTEVREAVERCRGAGIRVVMVTGDQAATASNIGRAVGIVDDEAARVVQGTELSPLEAGRLREVSLFARVSPEQKLDLIAAHQAAGAVVAMTGDGVNDAPALKKADIGIAMGRRGTQVAREAADMVLKDDALSSIVAAVREGRVIFGNIRRFVFYLLSCNVSEIMVVTGAALVRAPLPLLPLQILFLNLVTDVFPALALAFGEGDASVMERPPRSPEEPILTRRHWRSIAGYGLLIALPVMAALHVAVRVFGLDGSAAVTYSFLTLAFAQLWQVFNVRERGSPLLFNDVTRNPWVWGALALCTVLVLGAVYVPGPAALLRLSAPGPAGWAVVLGLSLLPCLVGQVLRSRRVSPPSSPSGSGGLRRACDGSR